MAPYMGAICGNPADDERLNMSYLEANDPRNGRHYYCFTRTWWRRNPSWPDGREPGAGRRYTRARDMTYAEARAFCERWNATHRPGKLSRKCEFTEQSNSGKRKRRPNLKG